MWFDEYEPVINMLGQSEIELSSPDWVGKRGFALGGQPSLHDDNRQWDTFGLELDEREIVGNSSSPAEKLSAWAEGLSVSKTFNEPPQPPPVIVTAHKLYLSGAYWVDFTDDTVGYNEPWTGEQTSTDQESVDIGLTFTRELTESERVAVENLKSSLRAIIAALPYLKDNALYQHWKFTPDGTWKLVEVYGSELKDLYSKTDWKITDNFNFGNNGPGRAEMHYGQPTIYMNIQALDAYDNTPGEMNWLISHEMGHLVGAGDPFLYTDQQVANDIARAALNSLGLPGWDNPPVGYSPGAPTSFTTPPEPGGGGGGGGGSTSIF